MFDLINQENSCMENWLDSDLLQDAASPYPFAQGIRGRSVSRSPSKLTPEAFTKVVRPKYAEALRLAAESLLHSKPQASAPLPHIFGSAAYLQDHTAGLGSILDPSLAEQQPASAHEEQSGDVLPDVEGRQQPAAAAPQADALQASIEALQGPTSLSKSAARLQSKAQQADASADLTLQGSGIPEVEGSSPSQAAEGGLLNLAKLATGPQNFRSMLEAALQGSMGGNMPDLYVVE